MPLRIEEVSNPLHTVFHTRAICNWMLMIWGNWIVVALMALKKKKAYDAHIDKINGTRMTIETQVMAIENANVNLETMNALRGGAEAMKNIHGSM